MDRHESTDQPGLPPQSVTHKAARSAALRWYLGSIVVFFLLIGAALIFWNAANPHPAAAQAREPVTGTSGYSTEGGHDPAWFERPGNTRDEIKYRGELTPPSEVRGR